MSETWGMIHPEVELLPIYEPVKTDNELSIPKIQWWGKAKIILPIPKGRKQRVKGVTNPQQVQKVPE